MSSTFPITRLSRRARTRSAVILTAAAFLLAACGGDTAAEDEGIEDGLETTTTAETTTADDDADAESASDSDAASADDERANDGAAAASDDAAVDLAEAEASAQEFSQCVRDAGVDIPDLAIDSSGQLDLGGLMAAVDPGDPAAQEALLSCQGLLPGGLAGSLNQVVQSESFSDALVLFSQCVRDDGYEVEDLTLAVIAGVILNSGAGASTDGEASITPILAAALGLDPDDPAVAETVNGCVSVIQGGLGDLGLGG